jgi:hypothetical protein
MRTDLKIVVALTLLVHRILSQSVSCLFGSCRPEGRIYPKVLDFQTDDPTQNSSIQNSAKNFRNFDVVYDFSLTGKLSNDMRLFLTTYLLDPVASKLERMIKVSGPAVIPRITDNGCIEQSKIPARYKTSVTKGDLVIFVAAEEYQAQFIAYAASCALSKVDFRPIVGLVTINTKFLKMQYSQIEPLKSVILHEILHILAFDVNLYDKFPIGATRAYIKEPVSTSSGQFNNVYLMILPGLLEYSRKHFNCPNLRGIYMENEGGQGSVGSHFERRWLGNELMTSESTGRMFLSRFTLHFLNDIGWYKVNFAFAEENPWGKNAGCDFFATTCDANRFPSFCSTPSRTGCSLDRVSKAQCVKSRFTDNCFLSLALDTYDCTNIYFFAKTAAFERPSVNSRCLDITEDDLPSTGCYPITCEANNKLRVEISDQTFYCTEQGQKIAYKQVSVTCPAYSEICVRPRCKNNCYGNGICLVNGDCVCNTFFRGKFCRQSKRCISRSTLCSVIEPALQNFDDEEDIGNFAMATGGYEENQGDGKMESINSNVFSQTEFDIFDRNDKDYEESNMVLKTAMKLTGVVVTAVILVLT